jgi:carbonic anhydrase
MDRYLNLLLSNQAWVQEKLRIRADYFSTTAQGQKPEFLWIGCSDSRVPAEDITGSGPGELFVHRNIANQVIPTDLNTLAVLQYGITVLKVKHVIVCGHYNCGGAAHAMKEGSGSPVEEWLEQLRALRRRHADELAQITDEVARLDRMVDLSSVAQMRNLASLPVVIDTWAQGIPLKLHAWVYDLRTGLLKELESIEGGTPAGGPAAVSQ